MRTIPFMSTALIALTASVWTSASADTIYTNIPVTLDPTGYYSQPYQADSLAEFGDRINFGGSARLLTSVTAWMDSYAGASDWTTYSGNTTVGGVHVRFHIQHLCVRIWQSARSVAWLSDSIAIRSIRNGWRARRTFRDDVRP